MSLAFSVSTDYVSYVSAFICIHINTLNRFCADTLSTGYVGSDCALSEDAVPNIIRTLGPSSCDLDRYRCQKVEMVTKDVKSLPNLVCKVEVTKVNTTQFNSGQTVRYHVMFLVIFNMYKL